MKLIAVAALALALTASAKKPAPPPVTLDAGMQTVAVATVLQGIPEVKEMLATSVPGSVIEPSPGSYVVLSDWPAGRTRALRTKLSRAGATGEAKPMTVAGESVSMALGEGAERVSLELTLERKKKDVILARGVLTTMSGTAPAPHELEGGPLSLVVVAWLQGGQAHVFTLAPAEAPAP